MLELIKGNSVDMDVNITLSGLPYQISGHQLWFTVKATRQDTDPEAYGQIITGSGISIINAASGFCVMSLTPQQTNNFPAGATLECDVQMRTPEGKVYTVLFEQIEMTERVTHAFSQ